MTLRDPRLLNQEPTKTEEQTLAEMQAKIEDLQRQLQEAQSTGLPREIGVRISPKGAVSVYGIHANFPVTLYSEQWDRVFEHQEKIKQFIEANKDYLDFKDDSADLLASKQKKRETIGIVPRTKPRTERIETTGNTKKAA